MKTKFIYICFVLTCCQSIYAQDFLVKNQNKVMAMINPSFYGFGESSKAGVVYGTEGYNDGNKIESRFGFANHYNPRFHK